jgi:hypothetical protein
LVEDVGAIGSPILSFPRLLAKHELESDNTYREPVHLSTMILTGKDLRCAVAN